MRSKDDFKHVNNQKLNISLLYFDSHVYFECTVGFGFFSSVLVGCSGRLVVTTGTPGNCITPPPMIKRPSPDPPL